MISWHNFGMTNHTFRSFFRSCVTAGLTIFGIVAIFSVIVYQQLPSVETLVDVNLQVPLKIYTADGKLIAEYGEKRRTPISIDTVPKQLVFAILATEDRRFFDHHGVDFRGLLRATYVLVSRGEKQQGGSTITMQVARNFFLSRQKTFTRKFQEILLAVKIERELSKNQILELYLNKIYFGKRAYGVEAAAEVYYGKSVTGLDLAQMAMLAGLPQAPSFINPLNNPEAALKRRAHVLGRMLHYGFIEQAQYDQAIVQPLSAEYHGRNVEFDAPYAAEWVRQLLVKYYGEEVYTSGFDVYTTIDSRYQRFAKDTVQQSLLSYDKRHGYRGPLSKVNVPENITPEVAASFVKTLQSTPKSGPLIPALILGLDEEKAAVFVQPGKLITLPVNALAWARREGALTLTVGNVIYLEPKGDGWQLSQIPQVGGALVSLDPHTGGVLALVGGFDFYQSKFNRVTQAQRQPGSNFKPVLYAAALENGFTAASIMNDAPIVFKDPTLEGFWRPQNSTKDFYGPTRLRVGLAHSRNLVSIRLLQNLGIKPAVEIAGKFGFDTETLPQSLSLALGSLVATPLQVVSSYAVFANGGYRVEPYIIHHIEDVNGNILYDCNPKVACQDCEALSNALDAPDYAKPLVAERILSPQTAYIMHSMLKDVITQGTGKQAMQLGRKDLAGKTGTTNDQFDAWFSGYHADIVTTTWMGFDEPKSLHEYAAQTALPLWMSYMSQVLKNKPERNFPVPDGIVTVRIDPDTGLLADPKQTNAIFEIFAKGTEPTTFAKKHTAEDEDKETSIESLY